ncbi:MAG: hypothetical protein N5P05_002862 [Chroococcopsis gigantea SAG 12.99]|jgi:hypothetical protein|nr:GNAT family N-acetyltransferase [Chlorogloea purpurea SAG 13.99]MDV3001256.1 hypothetical protein [Chroococcopsis gigantea SAG 12.99]
MTSAISPTPVIVIRPVQYRDLKAIESLAVSASLEDNCRSSVTFLQNLEQVRHWFGLLKVLSMLPNPFKRYFCLYVAESPDGEIQGVIQVSPFNISRSTWRVEQVHGESVASLSDPKGTAAQLVRHCLESIWEARTWVLEINIHQKENLALYRQHGFQPLAELTYWCLNPQLLTQLAEIDPDLPNLLPVSNADAQLLYQLDCVSMPPLLRQVFDRHIQDFKTGLVDSLARRWQNLWGDTEVCRAYVFEPQRKAAIGYFEIILSKNDNQPHQGKLTVHPAYTWLYPKLLSQMAKISQKYPDKPLELISADYQPERQEYLEKLGSERVEHTLLMSRSVWHKLREGKAEGLALAEVLQGLQAVPRTPIPSRINWLKWPYGSVELEPPEANPVKGSNAPVDSQKPPKNGHHA